MLLCWLLFIPFIGGLACWATSRGRDNAGLARIIAFLSMAAVFVPAVVVWFSGDFSLSGDPSIAPAWHYEIAADWISRFGIEFHLALDGLSLVMILLASVLGMLSVVASASSVKATAGCPGQRVGRRTQLSAAQRGRASGRISMCSTGADCQLAAISSEVLAPLCVFFKVCPCTLQVERSEVAGKGNVKPYFLQTT